MVIDRVQRNRYLWDKKCREYSMSNQKKARLYEKFDQELFAMEFVINKASFLETITGEILFNGQQYCLPNLLRTIGIPQSGVLTNGIPKSGVLANRIRQNRAPANEMPKNGAPTNEMLQDEVPMNEMPQKERRRMESLGMAKLAIA
uniref:Uncharacterized protein n=1 Tax=Acrobeloides nanus TaxID=290746 RepID=A0A914D0N3_9BILA